MGVEGSGSFPSDSSAAVCCGGSVLCAQDGKPLPRWGQQGLPSSSWASCVCSACTWKSCTAAAFTGCHRSFPDPLLPSICNAWLSSPVTPWPVSAVIFHVITLHKASVLETSSLQHWPHMWWLAWDNVAINFIKLHSSCNHRFGNWFLLMVSKSWTFQELWRVISIILALLFRSVLDAGVLVTEKSPYCRKRILYLIYLILQANRFIIFSTCLIDASDYYIISCNIN